jgi:hypothetical protein
MSDGKGIAYAMMAGGGLFVYSGAKGFSILKAVQNIVQGASPTKGQTTSLIGVGNTATNSETGVQAGAPPANASEDAWIIAMLAALGAPPTPSNMSSLKNWIQRETPWPPVSANNPLNTTQAESGSHSVNSVGVQAYPSAATGINATVTTLENGRYPAIVAALRAGKGLAGTGPWNAELSTWSGGGYSSV